MDKFIDSQDKFASSQGKFIDSQDHLIDGSRLVSKRNAKHAFRQQIFDAWGSVCAYCGVPADTLDHVKPRHRGGKTVADNLVPACKECNRSKGSEDWLEWFSRQETFTDERVRCVQRACGTLDKLTSSQEHGSAVVK